MLAIYLSHKDLLYFYWFACSTTSASATGGAAAALGASSISTKKLGRKSRWVGCWAAARFVRRKSLIKFELKQALNRSIRCLIVDRGRQASPYQYKCICIRSLH